MTHSVEVVHRFEVSAAHPPTGAGRARPDGGDGATVPHPVAARQPAPPCPPESIVFDPVPVAPRPQPMPLIRLLMPLMVVLMMGGMVALMIFSSASFSPMVLMFPMLMVVSLMASFAPQGGENLDSLRRDYLRHVDGVRETIRAAAAAQRARENFFYPAPEVLLPLVGTARMWERREGEEDFLTVRLGLGTVACASTLSVAGAGPAEELEPVCASVVREEVAHLSTVENMPLALNIGAFPWCVIKGSGAADLARAMILHLATFHGPESLGLAVLGGGWEWLKWLPHTEKVRQAAVKVLIVDAASARGVSSLVNDEWWDVVVEVGENPTSCVAPLAAEYGLVLNVTAAYHDADSGEHHPGRMEIITEIGPEEIGRPDALSAARAEIIARQLAPYRRPRSGASSRDLSFLDLTGVGSLAALEHGIAWQNKPAPLVATIGTDSSGAPVTLDIKEAALGGVGPHGLCIGATGSGKSELLKSLVAGLVATHSPEELNLVLIDFKGGATFLGMEELPHTSAVITNLEEEAELVDRMYDALSGEMNRRQELLRAAGNYKNVHDYAAARQHKPSMTPLPALFIVVDEFSELLGQHPDFADLFVAIGRLGRSLGIHLLLASQRLEEGKLRGLDSHLSYRIGLKTFSAAESRQVLGVPDAYHLPSSPGAGYLKTDAEQVERFQAAYVSGPLPVEQTLVEDADLNVSLFHGFNGWQSRYVAESPAVKPGAAVVPDRSEQAAATAGEVELLSREEPAETTVIAEVIAAATVAGKQGFTPAHRLWLPPLPAYIPVADVADDMGFLSCAVGVIDRPFKQRQDPLVLDFSGAGGHCVICGGPQTGKTTALRTIITSLAATHSAADIRFYIMDLGGSNLAGAAALPHVAAVATRGEEEKIGRMVDEVLSLIHEPEKRHTFLLIDGWHTVTKDYEPLLDKLGTIATDGLAARVHLIATTPRWSAMRPAVKDLMGERLELKMVESMDSVIDRRAQEKVPARPGRGITTGGAHTLLALSGDEDVAHIAALSKAKGEKQVPQLKELPQKVHLGGELAPTPTTFVLGQGGIKLQEMCWDAAAYPHLLVLGNHGAGRSTALSTIMAGICATDPAQSRLIVVDKRRAHLAEVPAHMLAAYAASGETLTATIKQLAHTLTERLPGEEVSPQQLKDRSWWSGPDLYLVVDDAELIAEADWGPLQPLLPHARDIGFHVVLARKTGGLSRALFQPFLSEIKDQSPAVLLLSADKDEGKIFSMAPHLRPPGRAEFMCGGVSKGLIHVGTAAAPSLGIPAVKEEADGD